MLALSMPSPSLTWIHLSDLHFGHGRTGEMRFDQETVIDAIRDDVRLMAGELGPPDVVFLTGDIAFSASTDEYSDASTWLGSLLGDLKIGPDRLLMVPGNHDVNRKKVSEGSSQEVHDALRLKPAKLFDYLEKEDKMAAIWPKLAAYQQFAEKLDSTTISAAKPFWTRQLDNRLGPVKVIGLNTVLLSFNSDDRPDNLALGLRQLKSAIAESKAKEDASLLLVLQHHPPEWLVDGEGLREGLGKFPNILLCGHVHSPHGLVSTSLDSASRIELVAGAGHMDAGDLGEHAYAWGRLTREGLEYYPRAWRARQRRFLPQPIGTRDDWKGYAPKLGEFVRLPREKLPDLVASWLAKREVAPLPPLAPMKPDALTSFLEDVAARVLGPAPSSPGLPAPPLAGANAILCAFADSLGPIMAPPLRVIWESDAHRRGARLDVGGPARPAATTEMTIGIEDLEPLEPVATSDSLIEVQRSGNRALRIEWSKGREVLWILGAHADRLLPTGAAPQQLGPLFLTLQALLHRQEATDTHLRSLQARINTLISIRPRTARSSFGDARSLLGDLALVTPDCLEMVENVASFALQQVLSAEWPTASERAAELSPLEAALRAALQHVDVCEGAHGPSTSLLSKDRARLRQRVTCALQCVGARLRPEAPLPDEGPHDSAPSSAPDEDHSPEALSMLLMWTQILEVDSLSDERWSHAVGSTIPRLTSYLQGLAHLIETGAPRTDKVKTVPSVRNRLCLWFCLTILRDTLKRGKADTNLRVTLAYVLRESLRFLCFGDRRDYFFLPRRYRESLGSLVVHHAYVILGVPVECRLDWLLRRIGSEEGSRYAGAEHLQHVLETYIAGHFVLSLELAGPGLEGSGKTVATVLASADDDHGDELDPARLRCAFSLAVLYHDVDYLFMPPRVSAARVLSGAVDRKLKTDRELEDELNKLGVTIGGPGKELIEDWIQRLQKLDWITANDEPLKRRFGVKPEKVAPENKTYAHGLMSAWFLYYIFTRSTAGVVSSELARVLRPAVRAVLLHDAADVPVNATLDPVASLLIMCNEMFDWDPERRALPSSFGRSLQVFATDALAPDPMYRSIEIETQHMRLDAKGDLHVAIDVSDEHGWPRIQVYVHDGLQETTSGVFLLWLRKAQNLGRISDGPNGWSPTIVMKSAVPSRQLTNAQVLNQVTENLAHRSLTTVREWLLTNPISTAGKIETAILGASAVRLYSVPIPMDILDEEADKVLRHAQEESELSQGDPPDRGGGSEPESTRA